MKAVLSELAERARINTAKTHGNARNYHATRSQELEAEMRKAKARGNHVKANHLFDLEYKHAHKADWHSNLHETYADKSFIQPHSYESLLGGRRKGVYGGMSTLKRHDHSKLR